MKKTLYRATKGYLCKSSVTLSIATKGYLCIDKDVEIIDKPFQYKNNSGGKTTPILKAPMLNRYELVRKENDDTILLIIKLFIECQENA